MKAFRHPAHRRQRKPKPLKNLLRAILTIVGLLGVVAVYLEYRITSLRDALPVSHTTYYYADGYSPYSPVFHDTAIQTIMSKLHWKPVALPPEIAASSNKTEIAEIINDIDFLYVQRFFPLRPMQQEAVCSEGRMFFNHIPHDEHLTYKDLVAQQLKDAELIGTDRQLGQIRYPETWSIDVEQQCDDMCKVLSMSTAELKKAYMVKTTRGVHNGLGIEYQPSGDNILSKYCKAQGERYWCGVDPEKDNSGHKLVQEYIPSALIQGRKFDIRHHVHILSADPLVVVDLESSSFGRVSNVLYNDTTVPEKFKHVVHIAAAGVAEQDDEYATDSGVIDNNKPPEDGFNWKLTDLAEELAKEDAYKSIFAGRTGRQWLVEDFLPALHNITRALFSSNDESKLDLSCIGSYGYLALDVMLDEKLNVWLLESSTVSNVWMAYGLDKESSSGGGAGLFHFKSRSGASSDNDLAVKFFKFQEARQQLIAEQGVESWKNVYAWWDIADRLGLPNVHFVIDERHPEDIIV